MTPFWRYIVAFGVLVPLAACSSYMEDLTTSLPNARHALSRQFSGYITIDETTGKRLFYWFIEAETPNPMQKPLTLWMNGGPACSSVGVGMFTEVGPLFPVDGGQYLERNNFTWARETNLLAFEFPAGVGFSYSDTQSDYDMDDASTARDNRLFLLRWLERFPHFKGHDLFIAGESYAGHFVTQLTYELWRHRKEDADIINVKGFAVGNGLTDTWLDLKGTVDFWFYHSVISPRTHKSMKENCFEAGNPWDCYAAYFKAVQQFGSTDMYSVYTESCASLSTQRPTSLSPQVDGLRHSGGPSGATLAGQMNFMGHFLQQRFQGDLSPSTPTNPSSHPGINFVSLDPSEAYPSQRTHRPGDLLEQFRPTEGHAEPKESPLWNISLGRPFVRPCIRDDMEVYLNRPDVQEAAHALPANGGAQARQWTQCSRVVRYNPGDLMLSMLPIYRTLLKESNIRMWFYSGDADGAIPFVGSSMWVNQLREEGHLRVSHPWKPWYTDNQVGGRRVGFNNGQFIFSTVRDAGHFVPYQQPSRGLHLFAAFLNGKI